MKNIFLALVLSLFIISCSHSEPGLGDPLVSAIYSRNFKVVQEQLSKKQYEKVKSKYSSYKDFLDTRLNKELDLHGKTPLLWACLANYNSKEQLKKVEKKRLKIVKFLVEKGANVNVRDKEKWTPLIWASWSGTDEIAKFLIEKGANIDAQTDKNWTALMSASLRGYDKVVKLLVEKGADKTLKNSQGQTAKDVALQYQKMHPEKKEAFSKIVSYLK